MICHRGTGRLGKPGFRRLPERNQGEQAAGGFLPVRKTGESAQTDVGKTVLQLSGRGCTELPDPKGEGAKLLELIREGMALITPESPNLTDYLYDWAYEEERDFTRWEWKARSCWFTLPVTRWLNV